MTASEYKNESLGSKLKHMLPGHKDEPVQGDRTDPVVAHDQVKSARAEHERMEADAERNIEEREALEAQQPPANPKDFTPPVVTNPRGPLSSFEPRNSLEHAAHGGKGPALPDLQGGTHIPEKELVPRHHESQHTALRPSDPNDPTAMDGAGDPRTAGDDLAI